MENIETGLLLLVVGMATVFAILLLIIYLGKGLIALVNRFAPEEAITKKELSAKLQTAARALDGVSDQTTAAIVSAISIVTGGKGKVIKIEKK